jgi:hypothetical protein
MKYCGISVKNKPFLSDSKNYNLILYQIVVIQYDIFFRKMGYETKL